MWMTWANLLTLARFALAPACALAIAAGGWRLAGLIFVAAVLTDLLDGPMARRLAEASPLGGVLDHATDAWFVALATAALAWQGFLPWPLPILIAAAFTQYVLDSAALRGHPLRGSWLGRWNGIAYFMVCGLLLLQLGTGLAWPEPGFWRWLGWLLVGSTVVSMSNRAVGWVLAKQLAVGARQKQHPDGRVE
jgi:phosphatidylglycerophosphate synthase